MSLLFNVERVKYTCSCGLRFPLCKLYLCKYCRELRCRVCVSHETDNFYCSNCMTSITGPEVRENKNLCVHCYNCPSCGHTLSPRLTTVQTINPENPQGEPLQRRQYYLLCACCRWSSRDADIADVQTHGTWSGPAIDDDTEKLLSAIKNYWATVGGEEAMEAQTKKYPKRRSYAYKRDQFQRRRSSVYKNLAKNNLLSPNAAVSESGQQKACELQPKIEALTEVEALPESYWTQPLNMNAVTSLQQRITYPAVLAETAGHLFPMRKTLSIKRSLRCRKPECDHNLIKPEYVPQSVKFKLHLIAQLSIPEIRLAKQPLLEVDKESECVFTVTNPSDTPVRVRLQPIDVDRLVVLASGEAEGEGDQQNTAAAVDEIGDILDELNTNINFADQLKSKGVDVGGKLSTLEFAGEALSSDETQYHDDRNVVLFRRANKIHIKSTVVPSLLGERIKVGFVFHFQLITDTPIASLKERGDNNQQQSSSSFTPEQTITPLSTQVLVDLGFAH